MGSRWFKPVWWYAIICHDTLWYVASGQFEYCSNLNPVATFQCRQDWNRKLCNPWGFSWVFMGFHWMLLIAPFPFQILPIKLLDDTVRLIVRWFQGLWDAQGSQHCPLHGRLTGTSLYLYILVLSWSILYHVSFGFMANLDVYWSAC